MSAYYDEIHLNINVNPCNVCG